ncbi:hypothetical protein KSS87_022105 [Heliosperma pusillum]|nr:hypothetical protein KSS87_022105 [Heliosperma pusillum]
MSSSTCFWCSYIVISTFTWNICVRLTYRIESYGFLRLELKGSKYILGEFQEFKGKHEDLDELQYIKRSKVDRMVVQKTSMFGLAPTRLQVLYAFRDYRNDGASGSEWKEVTVRSSTEVLFHPQNSKKDRKFKLSAVTSLTLSA